MPKKPVIPDGYLLGGDGKVRLEEHDKCANGHDITQRMTGPCPKCRQLAMLWWCADVRCGAAVASEAHKEKCQPQVCDGGPGSGLPLR